MIRKLWLAVGLTGLVAVTAASLLPMPELPGPDIPMQDKWLHFTAWSLLAWWHGQLARITATRTGIALALFAHSGLIELLQTLVDYRMGEPLDLLANGLGVVAGTLLALRFRPVYRLAAQSS